MAEDGQQQQKPPGTLAAEVSPEEAERVDRLNAMQWESLSSSRRDIISTADYSDNLDVPSVRELEATRRVNKPGTEEWSTARERKADLSAWNTAFQHLQRDGTAEEHLEDIAGGQTHRIKLADAQARSRETGENPNEDTKSRHRGGYETTRSDRARGGGVTGTRGRGDGRRGSARGSASRSMSTTTRPFETFGNRANTTARDHGGRDKRVKAFNPVSTTADSPSRGYAAWRQTALGTTVGILSREQSPTSTDRQMSTRSQQTSIWDEANLATPETFMAQVQSRHIGREATTAGDLTLPDANASNISSGAPGTTWQEVLEPNAASSSEGSVSQESIRHPTTPLADFEDVFGPEVDSAPQAIFVPTPPPPSATASETAGEDSNLIDLEGLEWLEGPPAGSRDNAAVFPAVASEDAGILARSVPDQISASSAVWSQLALLLPSIRSELDPSIVAQLEALAARGLTQSQTGGSARQTTSAVPLPRDMASSKPESASMDTAGLLDRTTWSRNVEAGDYEPAEDSPIIIGEHVYRGPATSKGSTATLAPTAVRTTDSNPFSPVIKPALQLVPQSQSVERPSIPPNHSTGAPEPAGQRISQEKPLSYSSTRARDVPQEHPYTALGRSNVLSSTSSERAPLPMAQDGPSSIDGLSSHVPAPLGPENDASTELGLVGWPPLEGNLAHSIYAPAGHAQQSSRIRRYASSSDDIIGEHLLPNLQRYSFGEGPSRGVEIPITAAHTRFNGSAAHTRFGSPAALGVIPPTATNITSSANMTLESPTLQLRRLNLGPDNSEVAASRREVEEEIPAEPLTVGNSEPSIALSVAALQYGPSTQALPSVTSLSTEPRQVATVHTVHPTMRASNLTSSWDHVRDRLAASASASASSVHVGSAAATTSSTPYGNENGRRGGRVHQQAPQLPAFLANNPPPSADPGAAAARQYGLGRPLSQRSSPSTHAKTERNDPEPGDSRDLQASVFAGPYTGPPSTDRPTLNSSGFLGPSNGARTSNPSSRVPSNKDAWDMTKNNGFW
ncbi:hypothetical protein LPUS_11764 [Lasallia pustulata]|uniref:Uncharacterized protein n=1 Tax=Lasallia pustulata TaxID=136370 RepID=A0A1W5DDH6_9LECA|nr:hypothetical protein LPUS_11764 [Lasallia pustulata]